VEPGLALGRAVDERRELGLDEGGELLRSAGFRGLRALVGADVLDPVPARDALGFASTIDALPSARAVA
jgi:hypothetical protein